MMAHSSQSISGVPRWPVLVCVLSLFLVVLAFAKRPWELQRLQAVFEVLGWSVPISRSCVVTTYEVGTLHFAIVSVLHNLTQTI
jgi:hypothetical protein